VVEDPEIKRSCSRAWRRAVASALLTTNTSGLGSPPSRSAAAAVRPRFFGTHFFNPPRYLHLLETIPAPRPIPLSWTG
jgi:3-hydroxyacyl-CoA dehydrogenase